MSELEGKHFIGNTFSGDDAVELVSIHDENGMWVLDCFKSGSEEILKRINGFEQFQQQNQELRARVVRLKEVLGIMRASTVAPYLINDEFKERVNSVLNETDQQSLAAIQVEAIEENKKIEYQLREMLAYQFQSNCNGYMYNDDGELQLQCKIPDGQLSIDFRREPIRDIQQKISTYGCLWYAEKMRRQAKGKDES